VVNPVTNTENNKPKVPFINWWRIQLISTREIERVREATVFQIMA